MGRGPLVLVVSSPLDESAPGAGVIGPLVQTSKSAGQHMVTHPSLDADGSALSGLKKFEWANAPGDYSAAGIADIDQAKQLAAAEGGEIPLSDAAAGTSQTVDVSAFAIGQPQTFFGQWSD